MNETETSFRIVQKFGEPWCETRTETTQGIPEDEANGFITASNSQQPVY